VTDARAAAKVEGAVSSERTRRPESGPCRLLWRVVAQVLSGKFFLFFPPLGPGQGGVEVSSSQNAAPGEQDCGGGGV